MSPRIAILSLLCAVACPDLAAAQRTAAERPWTVGIIYGRAMLNSSERIKSQGFGKIGYMHVPLIRLSVRDLIHEILKYH